MSTHHSNTLRCLYENARGSSRRFARPAASQAESCRERAQDIVMLLGTRKAKLSSAVPTRRQDQAALSVQSRIAIMRETTFLAQISPRLALSLGGHSLLEIPLEFDRT